MSTESSTPSPVVSSVAPSPAPAPRGRGPLFVAGGVAAAVLVFIGWGFWKAGQPPAPYFQGQMEAKEADIAPKVTARLLAEGPVAPGGEVWVALEEVIRPGWHTYWKNPGDAGQPTDIKWTLPAGVTADPIVWPAPTLYDVGGIINYGYHDDVLLLVKITPPADFKDSRLTLNAAVEWLVCEDVCIPEEGKLTLDLPVGATARPADAATRALFLPHAYDTATVLRHAARQVDSQGTASPLLHHFHIAAGLRGFDDAEGVLLPWHWQVARVVRRDLQEHPIVRSAFVRLPGRMQEPRAEADARCCFLGIAHQHAHLLRRHYSLLLLSAL